MSRSVLLEHAPHEAHEPPELREGSRDAVRLLVSAARSGGGSEHQHHRFLDLADVLAPGDLLVVNRSATVSASLRAEGRVGPFLLNLSTNYGGGVWLAEPRLSFDQPGPLPLEVGETFAAAGLTATFLSPYPGLPRLGFVRLSGDVGAAMRRFGAPIRYGYTRAAFSLAHYQTIFADTPGSAEMPSAARPFSARVLRALGAKGVRRATLTLHTGVSSLDALGTLYPEPFQVPAETVAAVRATKAAGGRVIAVGTTVVRALESAVEGGALRATQGFTSLYLRPGQRVNVVDGLLTGFHAPGASHLEMLFAVAGEALIGEAYAEALGGGYLWHEFGDSHLILPNFEKGRG